jgi:hypothetical protein
MPLHGEGGSRWLPSGAGTASVSVRPQIVIMPAMQKVNYDPVNDIAPIQRARDQSAGDQRQAAGDERRQVHRLGGAQPGKPS